MTRKSALYRLGQRRAKKGKNMRKLKKIPAFKSEQVEREFWNTHDTTDYFDYSKAQRVEFPNLKPTTTSISLRLSKIMLDEIKRTANKADMPYQSYIKALLDFGLRNFPKKR
jgi:predicted DNA binding CopG/RHH family protein